MKSTLRFLAALSLCLSILSAHAERLVLVGASYGKNILAITDAEGEVLWSHKTAGPTRGHAGHHDVHLLPNGNILFHDTWTTLKEITLDQKWSGPTTLPSKTVTPANACMSTPSRDSPMATP